MTWHKPGGDTQYTAVFFVVWGTACVALASAHGWKELIALGSAVCGAGTQAFVSFLQSSKE